VTASSPWSAPATGPEGSNEEGWRASVTSPLERNPYRSVNRTHGMRSGAVTRNTTTSVMRWHSWTFSVPCITQRT